MVSGLNTEGLTQLKRTQSLTPSLESIPELDYDSTRVRDHASNLASNTESKCESILESTVEPSRFDS